MINDHGHNKIAKMCVSSSLQFSRGNYRERVVEFHERANCGCKKHEHNVVLLRPQFGKLFLVRSTFFLRIHEYFLKRSLSKSFNRTIRVKVFERGISRTITNLGKTRSLHFLTERKENAIFHGRITRTRKVKNREFSRNMSNTDEKY